MEIEERNVTEREWNKIKEDQQKGLKESWDDVQLFIEYLRDDLGINFTYRYPSPNEDIRKHIDIFIIVDGKEYGVDVKGFKKLNRGDDEPCFEATFIELLNVNGRIGWTFGKEKYVAFRQEDNSFLIVEREKLAELALSKFSLSVDEFNGLMRRFYQSNFNIPEIKIKPRIRKENIIYDTLFHRRDRGDCIFLIRTEELNKIEVDKDNLFN